MAWPERSRRLLWWRCFSIAVFYCGGAGASGRGRGADDNQQALRIIFEPGLNMNTVDPEIDVAFGREVALAPAGVLLRPGLLEAPNGRGRKPAGVLAKRGNQMHFPLGQVSARVDSVMFHRPSDREPLTTFGYRAHLRRPMAPAVPYRGTKCSAVIWLPKVAAPWSGGWWQLERRSSGWQGQAGS